MTDFSGSGELLTSGGHPVNFPFVPHQDKPHWHFLQISASGPVDLATASEAAGKVIADHNFLAFTYLGYGSGSPIAGPKPFAKVTTVCTGPTAAHPLS